MGCPSSNYRKNESENCPVCDFLFDSKEAKGSAMVVEPFHNFNSLINALQEIDSELQVIANNQIHLMCPAEKDDEPWHTSKQKPPHFPSIATIICAPCNYDDTVFCLNELDVVEYKAKQKFSTLLFS
jgi:hypothetical protein